jgi:two-component system sensor histidine kinase CpxA
MKPRFSLSTRILLLAFLNVALLALVFAAFARVEYRFELGSFLLAPARDRMFAVSRLIGLDLPQTPRASWDQLLQRQGAAASAKLYLFREDGVQLAGAAVTLPPELRASFSREHEHGPPPFQDRPPGPHGHHPHGPQRPIFFQRTGNPPAYWAGIPIPVWNDTPGRPEHGVLVWQFSSLWANSFFFDYRPWAAVILAVVIVCVICWLPLIRNLTHAVTQLTAASERIAEGEFDVPVTVRRRDELGQLGQAIQSMAQKLAGYVHGQKRFLGDVAHELCSPIARIQVSLGILEQRATPAQREYVETLREEVGEMSALVSELLSFSKAQIGGHTALTRVSVAETVARVVEREASGAASIETNIDNNVAVMAQPDYLYRSIANLVRNAVRYAGDAGPIVIGAANGGGEVSITVCDQGPGLPEPELEEIFKPFYRPEFARQRETGGAGLGLAIVKTCVEACGGTVACRNRTPRGLEVEIRLAAG